MTSKIKSYVPRALSINSPEQYLAFIKHKHKVLPRLILNHCHPWNCQFARKKSRTIFLKIAKQLKFVHDLHIRQCYRLKLNSSPSKLLYFIKRMFRVKILFVRKSVEGDRSFPTFSHFWPKYMKSLRALSFDTPYLCSPSPFRYVILRRSSDFQTRTRHLSKIKSIRFISKYQNRLHTLEIGFEETQNYQEAEKLDPNFSCPSLRKLALHGGNFISTAPLASFNHLRNLKALELSNDLESSSDFCNSILCLLPKLLNLESLSFYCRSEHSPELKESFQSVVSLTLLKYVRVFGCNLSLSHSKTLLKALQNLSLKSLCLHVTTKNRKELKLIINLLERLTQLETLKLEIDHIGCALEPLIIEKIFQKVDNLHFLKRLSLKIWTEKQERVETIIELPFSKLFTKAIPLEAFKVECNLAQIFKKTLFDLLKAFSKRASYLKRFQLGIGELVLDETEFPKLLKFLNNLTKIRVLKLPMIGIHQKSSFMEMVDLICMMKNLRSFVVGKFYTPVIGLSFPRIIEKILCKNGLLEFDCSASQDFTRKIKKKNFKIDWKKIKKLNPMFYAGYKIQQFFPEQKKVNP